MNNYTYASLTSLKRPFTRLFSALALGALLQLTTGGCGVTAQEQTLGQQTFQYAIPSSSAPPGATLPMIPCTNVGTCNSVLKLAGISLPGLTPVCDAGYCGADLRLTILYVIDAAKDPAFTLGIAQGQADKMRDVKMTYGITSTMNLAINQIDVYAGADGIKSVSDPKAQYLGTVGPVPAMGLIPDSHDNYLLIEDGTPPHTQFVNYAKHPEDKFDVLMVATTPRLKVGDPIPSGSIEVRMVPIVTLLNR